MFEPTSLVLGLEGLGVRAVTQTRSVPSAFRDVAGAAGCRANP